MELKTKVIVKRVLTYELDAKKDLGVDPKNFYTLDDYEDEIERAVDNISNEYYSNVYDPESIDEEVTNIIHNDDYSFNGDDFRAFKRSLNITMNNMLKKVSTKKVLVYDPLLQKFC